MEQDMKNELLDLILSRRSCKCFKSDPVPQELIDKVIEAGLYAANGSGLQSAVMIEISDKETRDWLMRLNAKYDPKKREDPFYNAPVVIPVLGDKSVSTHVCDASLVIGNMLLAAHALGLGSCWIHRAKQCFEDEEGKALLKKLGIEADLEGVGNLILGYPACDPEPAAERREGRVFKV